MPPLRSPRALPVLLALSLVLTAAAPLVQHACAEAEVATMPCCPPGTHDAPDHDAPPCHGAPAEHETPTEPEVPCHDASDWATLRAACCGTLQAPAAPALERAEWLPADLASLVAAFVLPPEPSTSPPRLIGESPPPAPVALHVLYERFLI